MTAASPRWWHSRTSSRIWSERCDTGPTVADSLLAEADWTTRERVHRRRVEEFLAPHLERARVGEPHPVWDFLFRYYSLRPRQLRVWHPGFGVVLGGPGS